MQARRRPTERTRRSKAGDRQAGARGRGEGRVSDGHALAQRRGGVAGGRTEGTRPANAELGGGAGAAAWPAAGTDFLTRGVTADDRDRPLRRGQKGVIDSRVPERKSAAHEAKLTEPKGTGGDWAGEAGDLGE